MTQLDTMLVSLKCSVMPTRKTMNISVTPELERFVASRVASGRYQSASEVVRAGLRLLERHEAAQQVSTQQPSKNEQRNG